MRRTQEKFLEAMQKGCLALNLRLDRRKHNLTADQTLRKMTASIKEREDKLCDREDYTSRPEIKRKQEEQLRQQETLEAKEGQSRPEDRLKGRRRYHVDRDTDGQEQRLAERAQELQGKKRLSRRRLLSWQIRPGSLTQGRRPGRTRRGSKTLRGLLGPVERKCKPVKRLKLRRGERKLTR